MNFQIKDERMSVTANDRHCVAGLIEMTGMGMTISSEVRHLLTIVKDAAILLQKITSPGILTMTKLSMGEEVKMSAAQPPHTTTILNKVSVFCTMGIAQPGSR